MSIVKIRKAFEVTLAAMGEPMATAWENSAYQPVAETPYQAASLVLATPVNAEYGASFQQGGDFQVALRWPPGQGSGDIDARAELLRSTFARGVTLTADGLSVLVVRTPVIMPAFNDEAGRYVVAVSIPFLATIQP